MRRTYKDALIQGKGRVPAAAAPKCEGKILAQSPSAEAIAYHAEAVKDGWVPKWAVREVKSPVYILRELGSPAPAIFSRSTDPAYRSAINPTPTPTLAGAVAAVVAEEDDSMFMAEYMTSDAREAVAASVAMSPLKKSPATFSGDISFRRKN